MKNACTALLILMSLTPNISNAIPQPSAASTQAQMTTDSQKQVAMLHKTLDTTKRALNRYYSNEKSWPSSLKVLESKGYLPTNYTSLLGTLTYGGAGNTLTLSLNIPTAKQSPMVATRVAALSGGKANGSSISIQLTPPVGFIDPDLYIDRLNPKALATDINMNGRWVKSGSMQGGIIDVSKATGDTLSISRDAAIGRNVLITSQLQGNDANLSNTAYQGNANALSLTTNGATTVGGKTEATSTHMNANASFAEAATLNGAVTAQSSVKLAAPLVIAGNATLNNASIFQSMQSTQLLTALGGITGTQATFQNGLIEQIQSKDVTTNAANVTGKINAKDVQAGNLYAVNGDFSGNLTTQGLATKSSIQANTGLYVGTNNTLVADKDGNLYQRGKQLNEVFLGKDAKAADTQLLDGLSASDFSILTQDHTYSAKNTFNGLVQFNSIGYAGGKQFIDPATGRLSEAGQSLDSRYLGLNAKAADSALLDGLAASAYGQLAVANIFSQRATFTQGLRVNGAISSTGTAVANNGQWFEGGQALTLRYLGIHGKAADSKLLDGLQATQIAQKGSANSFTGSNTFTQDVVVGGQALLGSVRAVESRTSSLEGRVASTNSQLDNLLYIKSRCKVHAKDPGCQFVFIPKVVYGNWSEKGRVYTNYYQENGAGGCYSSTAQMRQDNANPPSGSFLPKYTSPLMGTCSPKGASAYYHLKECITSHGGSSNQNFTWRYQVYQFNCE
ncbi:TPA: hypothetical protein RQN23_004410 [Aeromonas veronii]|nr:hypothetical protein [Aeromonas veronii]